MMKDLSQNVLTIYPSFNDILRDEHPLIMKEFYFILFYFVSFSHDS